MTKKYIYTRIECSQNTPHKFTCERVTDGTGKPAAFIFGTARETDSSTEISTLILQNI